MDTEKKKNHFNVSIALDLKDFGVFSHFVGVGLLKLSNMSKHFIVGRQKISLVVQLYFKDGIQCVLAVSCKHIPPFPSPLHSVCFAFF